MSRYKAYPEYRDSGVVWFGRVPVHWAPKRFKQVLADKKKTFNSSLDAGSISFGRVVLKDGENLSQETKDSYQEVLSGEYLVNPLNLNYDLLSLRTALSEIDVVVSTGYIVLKSAGVLKPRYIRWLLHEFDVSHMKTLGAGVRAVALERHFLRPASPAKPLTFNGLRRRLVNGAYMASTLVF